MQIDLWITSAKQALTLLSQTEMSIPYTYQIPLSDLVVLGQRLWWAGKRTNKILDSIKFRLRDEAQKRAPQSTHRFDGSDFVDGVSGSHCLVIPNPPTLGVRKDTDIPSVKRMLGDRFSDFFEEVVVYKPRKDFRTRLAACPEPEQAVLMGTVDITEGASRVVFKD